MADYKAVITEEQFEDLNEFLETKCICIQNFGSQALSNRLKFALTDQGEVFLVLYSNYNDIDGVVSLGPGRKALNQLVSDASHMLSQIQ